MKSIEMVADQMLAMTSPEDNLSIYAIAQGESFFVATEDQADTLEIGKRAHRVLDPVSEPKQAPEQPGISAPQYPDEHVPRKASR